MGHLGKMVKRLGKHAAQMAQDFPFEPKLLALKLAQRLRLHGDEVRVTPDAGADGKPLNRQTCLVGW